MSVATTIDLLLTGLEDLAPVAALRGSTIAYPLVAVAHVAGVALLFGAIVPLDLRLAGWRAGLLPTDLAARLLLPVAKVGLAIAVLAGMLLFATAARNYAASPLFQLKMMLIGLAIANALALRRMAWSDDRTPRSRVRSAGAVSAMLWLGVVVLGRLVGYF